MNMIIGGIHQGKTEFAIDRYGLRQDDIADGAVCSEEDILNSKAVDNLNDYIKRHMNNNEEAEAFAHNLVISRPDIIIITTEVGYGLVPIEREERIYREAVGRACCILAANSDVVYRMVCGIPQLIKG